MEFIFKSFLLWRKQLESIFTIHDIASIFAEQLKLIHNTITFTVEQYFTFYRPKTVAFITFVNSISICWYRKCQDFII